MNNNVVNECTEFLSSPLISSPLFQYHKWLCSASQIRAQAVPGEGPDPPAHCQVSLHFSCAGQSQTPRHSHTGDAHTDLMLLINGL